MSDRQPDWTLLNAIAASFLASTPLAARIAATTPPGDQTVVGLHLDLAEVVGAVAAASTRSIAADTLTIPAGPLTIATSGVEVVARSIRVAGGGAATLVVKGPTPAAQITTAEIVGNLTLQFEAADGSTSGGPIALRLAEGPTPQVLTFYSGSDGTAVPKADAAAVADVMHQPAGVLSLEIVSALAGVIADNGTSADIDRAAAMQRWVSACCFALLRERASYADVNYDDVASLAAAAAASLVYTQAAVSGAVYVPILSSDLYQSQIDALLRVAKAYDAKITALAAEGQTATLLGQFAATLSDVERDAAGPLRTTLKNLARESSLVETQLLNAAIQLKEIGATLPGLQYDLIQAIDKKFQTQLMTTAFAVLTGIVTLYVGAAAAVMGDPLVLAAKAPQIIKAAGDITAKAIAAGAAAVNGAIANGSSAAQAAQSQEPTAVAYAASETGAQVLSSSVTNFGSGVIALWSVVQAALDDPDDKGDYSPEFLDKFETLPNLSGFSTGGIDPATYWTTVVVQTEAAVQPHAGMPAATAYLAATKLAGTYGASVGDLQMKLLDLYAKGITAFARLQAVRKAQARWSALEATLADDHQKIAAATGLLQRGYLDIKRSIVSAVNEYRAASFYQWLQPSPVRVDVTMDYQRLARETADAVAGLEDALKGSSTSVVRPRQTFTNLAYEIERGGLPLFDDVGGRGQARWSISNDKLLAADLAGNTAVFLTEASFVLEGEDQPDEVQLVVETSGSFSNILNGETHRFVTQAISMDNVYSPGHPPRFVTSWSFADPASYLEPTPYTNWTLTVLKGNWRNVTSIRMTMSGKFLQNSTVA